MYATKIKSQANSIVNSKAESFEHTSVQKKTKSAAEFLKPNQPNMFDAIQRKESGQEIKQRKPNKTGLPDQLKSGVENLSGFSMDNVRVHYNSSKPAQLHALAYTQGTEIHVAPGQEKHLPHEAWHVVQQMQGRVRPTMQMKGVGINDDPVLEHEADVMGERFFSANISSTNLSSTVQKRAKFMHSALQRMTCSRCMREAEFNGVRANRAFTCLNNSAKWFSKAETPDYPNHKNHPCIVSFDLNDAWYNGQPKYKDEENDRPKESEHRNEIILKNNEPNNFGVGSELVPIMNTKISGLRWSSWAKLNSNSSKKWNNL